MKSRAFFILSGLSLTLAGCSVFSKKGMMPGRNESYSYSGPGSNRVERAQFSKIYFADDSAKVPESEERKLREVVSFLKVNPPARILIVGFAHDPGTDEYNRVLGEQRAQAVRALLLEKGCPESALQTLSFGADESAKTGADARRVELGIVR